MTWLESWKMNLAAVAALRNGKAGKSISKCCVDALKNKVAAKVAKDVQEGVGSIKQLVYESKSKHPNIKAIYALVATLFQRNDEIDSLLKRSQLLVKEPRSDPWLTKILIVELLWGKKSLPGHSKPEKTVLAYEQIFKGHMSDVTLGLVNNDLDIKEELKPRYVRVNTLRMNFNEAIDAFREEGWVLSKFLDKKDYKGFLDKITGLGDEEFLVDIHIPHLLIFPPKTQFYNHPAYKNGSIILQDKASCLPVHILGPPPGSVILDMCSAPGMKTTQVASAINNEGKVYAVERDPRRFETLNRIVEASGATCITTINKDVLTCTTKDFPEVQYILVDPSCSGSGIVGRHGYDQAKSNERIEKLAGFQIKILRSALTRYPNVKRVVYSTCSVHLEENEDVVRQVLETNSKFKLVPAMKFVNDTWKNFGSSEYGDIGSYCLYAKPNEDFTNGFFVAVFERLEEDEQNQFFNTKIYNFKKHLQSQEKRKRKQLDMDNENTDDFGNNVSQNLANCTESKINAEVKEEFSNTDENEGVMRKKKKHGSETNNFSNNIATDNSIKKEKKRKSETVSSVSEEGIFIQDTMIKPEKEELGNESIKREFSKSGKRKHKNKDKDAEDITVIENESSDSVRNDSIQMKNKKNDSEITEGATKTKKKRKSNNENLVHDEIIKEENEELNVKEEEPTESSKRRKKKNSKDFYEDVTLIENKYDNTVEKDQTQKKKKKNISENADCNIFIKLEDSVDVVKKEKRRKFNVNDELTQNKDQEGLGNASIKEENTESAKQKKKKSKHFSEDDVNVIEIESNDPVENHSIQGGVEVIKKEKRRKSRVLDEPTEKKEQEGFGKASIKEEHPESQRNKKNKDLPRDNVIVIELDSNNSVGNNSIQDGVDVVKKEKRRKFNVNDELTQNKDQEGLGNASIKEENTESAKQKKKKSKHLSEDDVTVIEIESNDHVENNSVQDGVEVIKKEKRRKSRVLDEPTEKKEQEGFGKASIKEEHPESQRKKKNKDLPTHVTVIELESNDPVGNNSIQDGVDVVKKEKRRKSNISDKPIEKKEREGFGDEFIKEENLEFGKKKKKKKNKDLPEDNVALIEIESDDPVENNSVRNRKKKNSFNEDVDSNMSIKLENTVGNGDIIKKKRKNKSNDTDELTESNVANIRIAKKEKNKHKILL